MKVAILCSGLGRVRRGFERFADELGQHLRPHADVDVYGARALDSRVVRVRSTSRDGVLARLPYVARHKSHDPYYWEAMTFSAAVSLRLRKGRYDVIHVIDPPIVNFLHRSKRLLNKRSKVVFTNGVGMHDPVCTRADHLHQVSPVIFAEASRYMPESRMTFVPHAVDPHPLLNAPSKVSARKKLAIPLDGSVVLSVAALNRRHKRMHILIEEVAAIPDVTLLAVGRVEDPSLVTLGHSLLGNRFVHRELSFDEISIAYGASDVFALTSVEEGFAMSVVEAMIAALPVLVHRNEHFHWLVGDEHALVDMTEPGQLAARIENVLAHREDALLEERSRRAVTRFSWDELIGDYLAMYTKVIRN